MIRRGVAGLILAFSLILGSLAWSGYLALQTIFDPDESSEIATELLDNTEVRRQLISNVSGAIERTVPAEIEVPSETIDAAAATVLEDPAVKALIIEAFAQTHAAFLGEGNAPEQLDGGAIGVAVRDAVVTQAPELASVLPASPELVVPLPTERIPNAGPLRRFLETAVPPLAAISIIGVLITLVTTSDRPSVMRRAGRWALTTTAVYLIVGLGVPWLARRLIPDQAEILAAFLSAALRSTIPPAIALAVGGVIAITASLLWPAKPTRGGRIRTERPARYTAEPPPAPPPRRAPEFEPSRPAATSTPTRVQPRQTWDESTPGVGTILPPPDRSAPEPSTLPTPPQRPVEVPVGRRPSDPLPPRWVEGVGWVLHPSDPDPPPEARWIAGHGYVIEGPPPGVNR